MYSCNKEKINSLVSLPNLSYQERELFQEGNVQRAGKGKLPILMLPVKPTQPNRQSAEKHLEKRKSQRELSRRTKTEESCKCGDAERREGIANCKKLAKTTSMLKAALKE